MVRIAPCRPAPFARLFGTAVAGVLLMTACPARAQSPLGTAGNVDINRRGGPQVAKPEIQPPALPGSKAPVAAAPATKIITDMSPNDALFDAINRGDIGTVRDALSRGADLRAHNVLGMTPLELSVDLGRNDISFLLLSMRGETSRSEGPPPQAAAAPPVPAKAEPVAKATRRPTRTASAKAPRTQSAPPPEEPARQVYASDGGTPNPSVGFLGFDAGKTTR